MSVEVLKFHEQMESNGCYARMVSVDHLAELKDDVEGLLRDGLLDATLYKEYLAGIDYEVPKELPDARSIIVVARPQPIVTFSFRWKDREIPVLVPPTYADGESAEPYVLAALAKATSPETYRYVRARLPLKSLAAHSGLVAYGRNNVTYLPKVGSFHRLIAFFSDLPCKDDQWQERKMLAGCDSCRACVQACPTEAITEDRFLVRAERCLSYLNEKSSAVPFPEWVDPAAHNAVVGCMRCQRACPYDKGASGWMDSRGQLSEEETAYLLKGEFSGEEAKAMEEKLKKLGLELSLFPRNLEALLRAKG